MDKLQAELGELRKRAEQLAAKRGKAQIALDAAMADRQRHLLDGDLDDEKTRGKLQAAVDSATSSLAGFDGAIKEQAALIAGAEAKLAEARQAAERQAASEKLAARIRKIDEVLPPWLEATRDMASAMEAISWRAELAQMAHYLRNVASEIENAERLTFPVLHALVGHIRDGLAPIPREPEALVPPTVVKPELVQVFTLKAIEWTDTNGMQRQSAKWHDVSLPPEAAQHALRLKLACPMSDQRRKQFHGQPQTHPHPEPAWLNNLDTVVGPDIATQPALEPVLHSAFEKPTIGPAKIVQIAVPTRSCQSSTQTTQADAISARTRRA